VVEGEVTAVFFFVDPLGKHPHDPDIQMLLRICNVHNVPLATNEASAVCIMTAIEIANTPPDASVDVAALQKTLRPRISSPDQSG